VHDEEVESIPTSARGDAGADIDKQRHDSTLADASVSNSLRGKGKAVVKKALEVDVEEVYGLTPKTADSVVIQSFKSKDSHVEKWYVVLNYVPTSSITC
jgi:hypothetical protein